VIRLFPEKLAENVYVNNRKMAACFIYSLNIYSVNIVAFSYQMLSSLQRFTPFSLIVQETAEELMSRYCTVASLLLILQNTVSLARSCC
jgi:hypothetical protein